MNSNDGYSALADDLGNVAKRVSRLERRVLGTPQPNAVDLKVEEMLRDKVRDLNEKAEKDANLIQDLYKRIDEAHETKEQFKKAADDLNAKYWKERAEALYGADMSQGLTEINKDLSVENLKLRNENAELKAAIQRAGIELGITQLPF